jgi:iron complex transport system substrate-binding protein
VQDRIGRRAFLVGAGAVVALAGCSGESKDSSSTTTSTTGEGSEPEAPQPRALLLGEEYLLADALALGVTPVASTATVVEVGFIGVDDHDTSGIQALNATDQDLEPLVALDTDIVVAAQYVADALGTEALEPFGELTVVRDGSTPVEVLGILAGVFGREAEAEEIRARLEEAEARAREEIPPQEVSVAAIYPGPSPAVFVDGPWAVPQTLLDAGCTLVPGADEPHDEDGRVYLSLENLDLIAGPTLILMQSEAVEGEAAAVEQLQADPLWTELPAPAAGRVHTLDRLGYPGVEGQIRLIDDLIGILGG